MACDNPVNLPPTLFLYDELVVYLFEVRKILLQLYIMLIS